MPLILGVGIDWSSHEAVPLFKPGTVAQDPETFALYKYLKYDDGTAALSIVPNRAVVYVAETGYETHTCTRDYSDGDGVCAGVAACEGGGVVTDQDYIWVQISGLVTMVDAIAGSASDGDGVTAVGAGDGAFTLVTAADHHVAGFTTDASAKKVVLNCPW